MSLADLLEWVEPQRKRIHVSANPEATNIDTRLQVSARHVAASRLGVLLFDTPETLAIWESGATVQIAGLMTALGSAQTSIDLCATALLRWHGHIPPENREWDFNNLLDRLADGRVSLTTNEQEWVDVIDHSEEWEELTNLRNAIIHRIVSQSATVRPGGQHTYTISPSTTQPPGPEEARVTLDRLVQFAEERWRQFWAALGVA